jgi:DNA-binding LytR/AlgR family response regulator
LLEDEQCISSIASKLGLKQIDLDAELSSLQKAGYIDANTDVWESCVETRFFITEKGLLSFQHYTGTLDNILTWVKGKYANLKKTISLNADGKRVSLPVNSIQYIKSCGNYIKIITEESTYVSLMTTSNIEELLSGNLFLRIHKSYIVNTSKVLNATQVNVTLENAVLPIGKTFKKFTQQFIRQYKMACH